MGDLNSFLAEGTEPTDTPPGDEPTAIEPTEPAEGVEPTPPAGSSDEPAAEQPEDQPPTGDKRDQAIWREERARRKELQAQVDKMNERWQQMVERMQNPPPAQPAVESKPDQEIEIPDFDEDPIGHLRAKNDLLEKQLAEVNQFTAQSREQAQRVHQLQQLQSSVDAMETEFRQTTPDYGDAVNFLYGSVARMAQAMGYSPQQVEQVISQTAMDITARALQSSKNPAQAAYEAAKAMGWTGKPAEAPAAEAEPAPRPKVPTSLSSVAGRPTAGTPTLDAIADMSEEEFNRMWSEMEKSARRG